MKKRTKKGTKKTAKTALVLAMACMMGMSSLTGCGILKTDDKKTAISQTQQAKPGKEQKPTEQKPTEQKPTEQKPTEQKPTEQKPTEQKPTEQKPTGNQEEQKTEENNKEEVKEVTGKIESKKDSMVTVVDDKKAAYAFSFQEKPEGFDAIAVGDTVTVKYTGTVSDTEAFSGKVISITKQNSDEKKPTDNKAENNKKENNKKENNKKQENKQGDKKATKPSASTKK